MAAARVNQWLTFIANISVVAGIVFLAIELHQNSEQLAGQSRFNYFHGRAEAYRALALDGDLAEIFVKELGGEVLTPTDQMRINAFFVGNFTLWEYEFSELRRGLIGAREFNVDAKRDAFNSIRPATEPAWAIYRETAPDDFVNFMENEILSQTRQ